MALSLCDYFDDYSVYRRTTPSMRGIYGNYYYAGRRAPLGSVTPRSSTHNDRRQCPPLSLISRESYFQMGIEIILTKIPHTIWAFHEALKNDYTVTGLRFTLRQTGRRDEWMNIVLPPAIADCILILEGFVMSSIGTAPGRPKMLFGA